MVLLLKALFGALIVAIIAFLSETRSYFIAGLVPLFPTFTLIAHFTVGSSRTHEELKNTIMFSLWAVIPYLVYLLSSYYLIDRMSLKYALGFSAVFWCMAAGVLLFIWTHTR